MGTIARVAGLTPDEFRRLILAPVSFSLSPAASRWYRLAMTIALAKDVEKFLREQVRAGVAADPSELANDVLRCVRDQQRKPFEITPQLETWLLEAADQPATPLTKADFDGIRQRARKRNRPFAA
jgi:Arc/MetJ-type ribon-helix-helix transcriptional regulator